MRKERRVRPGFTPAEDILRFRPRQLAQRDGDTSSPHPRGARSLADLLQVNESQASPSLTRTERAARANPVSPSRADQATTWKKEVHRSSRSEGKIQGAPSVCARSPETARGPETKSPTTRGAGRSTPSAMKEPIHSPSPKEGRKPTPTPRPPKDSAPKAVDVSSERRSQSARSARATSKPKDTEDAPRPSAPERTDDSAVDSLQSSIDKLSLQPN